MGALVTSVVAAGCGSTSHTGSSSAPAAASGSKGAITWWVPGPDVVAGTSQKLAAAFTKKTGIKVHTDVIPWGSYDTNLQTALTSGDVPDLVEIGNTDAATYGREGKFISWTPSNFNAIGGKGQFLATPLEVSGQRDGVPTSLPIYAGTWILEYNKQLFAAAHITHPPTTWAQFYTDAKALSHPAQNIYGVGIGAGAAGAMNTWSWIVGQQFGVPWYTKAGQPDVATAANTTAITKLIQWVYPDRIMSPADVADSTGSANDTELAKGKAAMDITQNPGSAISNPAKFGISYVPLPSPTPSGGRRVMSHIAGVNLAVFKSSKHLSEDMKFVKFLATGPAQALLGKGEASLPTTKAGLVQPYFQSPSMKVYGSILSKYAASTPTEASATSLLNAMGTAMVHLYQSDAASHSVSSSQVSKAINAAQQTVAATSG